MHFELQLIIVNRAPALCLPLWSALGDEGDLWDLMG